MKFISISLLSIACLIGTDLLQNFNKSSRLYAQTTSVRGLNADSLLSQLKTDIADSTRAKILNDLAAIYNRKSLFDSSIYFAQESQKVSKKVNNSMLLGRSLQEEAISRSDKGEYRMAEKLYKEAIEEYRFNGGEKGERGIASVYMNYGLLLTNRGEYVKAMEIYFNALKIRDALQDTFGMGGIFNNLGLIYEKLEKYDEALAYYRKAEKIARQFDAQTPLAATLNNIGIICERLQKYHEAIQVYEEALSIKEKTGNKRSIAVTISNLANSFRALNQLDLSLTYDQKAIKIQEEIGDKRSLAISYRAISTTYSMLGQIQKSYFYAQRSREITESIGLREELPKVYLALFDLSSKIGKPDSSNYWIGRYVGIRDSIFNEGMFKRTEELKALYEAEKKELEISALTNQATIAKLEKEQERIIFLGGGLGLGAIILLLGINVRQKKKAALELEKQNALLIKLNEELVKANQVKSNLLAITSHDLKNPLQIILGLAELIHDSKAADESIKKLSSKILSSTDRMYKLILDLLDNAALEQGYIELKQERVNISQLLEEITSTFEAKCTSKNQEMIKEIESGLTLQSDSERLTQVFENLLSNAIKYSPSAKRIWIKAKRSAMPSTNSEAIEIKFIDEGQGFYEHEKDKIFGQFQKLSARPTAGESSSGLGLSIVKQLVERMGGLIESTSAGKDKGAEFTIYFPVNS
ncbi:MAG: tetratricopeptide repeat-containing sensor histidine kinase [Chloroherpetonaceae bacterium]|nr:tetratricopeptide repeat-containing sensor histidine kinase [Chloroherpetonaceae bacterium]